MNDSVKVTRKQPTINNRAIYLIKEIRMEGKEVTVCKTPWLSDQR